MARPRSCEATAGGICGGEPPRCGPGMASDFALWAFYEVRFWAVPLIDRCTSHYRPNLTLKQSLQSHQLCSQFLRLPN